MGGIRFYLYLCLLNILAFAMELETFLSGEVFLRSHNQTRGYLHAVGWSLRPDSLAVYETKLAASLCENIFSVYVYMLIKLSIKFSL